MKRMPIVNTCHSVAPLDHPEYLRDESRRSGHAQRLIFPANADELAAALAAAAEAGQSVTLQGARTGIVAGAVPDGGWVVSLIRMDRILGVSRNAAGEPCVRLQPGVPLRALRAFLDGAPVDQTGWTDASRAARRDLLKSGRWLFPPDPTEQSASLGGMVSCNASGACSFAYGPTRGYVEAVTLVLADGDRLELRRGRERAAGRHFELTTVGGRRLAGRLPDYRVPAVKSAAGYWVCDDMDLLDLVIGSEGTLGALAEIDVRLIPRPAVTWGVVAFMPSESAALDLVEAARAAAGADRQGLGATLAAIEYFDADVLHLLRADQAVLTHLPPLRHTWHSAVYLELAGPSVAGLVSAAEVVDGLVRRTRGHPGNTWVAWSDPELARLKAFRHAAPERVNLRIAERQRTHPQIAKLGTDLAVPDARLRDVMGLYREGLARAGLTSVIFGHIGDNHLHVNILPRDMDDYAAGRRLYGELARQVVAWGGSVAAEHGIGRLKTGLLEQLYGAAGVAEMRRLKRIFDPQGRLNAGVLFAP